MALDPAREAEVETAVAGFTEGLKDGMTVLELRALWMRYITAGHKRLAVAFLGDARKTARVRAQTEVVLPPS